MSNLTIGDVDIPMEQYAISGTALLGVRGTGKTTLAKAIAEQLMDRHIPIIAFDPIGVWRYLRVPANKDGKGYPVVVAGGADPDLALTPQTAPEIVRAAMRENISLVIDLYDKNLSKADWKRIVKSCFHTLLYENKAVRHIFLEETAEFAPQRVGQQDGETYAAVEKLVRMGGNYSLGITLINQRAQEVNKAVLDLCENLVLMRQTGSHAIDALEKWVDRLAPKYAQQIADGMPSMQAGNAWVFASGENAPSYTRGQALMTFHPDRKRPNLKTLPPATDTSVFVDTMKLALPAIAKEQAANDPKALRAEIETLRKHLAGKAPLVDVEALRGRIKRDATVIAALRSAIDSARGEITIAMSALAASKSAITVDDSYQDVEDDTPAPAKAAPARERDSLNGTAARVLKALAEHPEGITQSQLCAFAGLAARTISNQTSLLRKLGYIEPGLPFKPTAAGIDALGRDYEPLPTGEALFEHWKSKLASTAAVVLTRLYQSADVGLSAGRLSEVTGLAPRTISNQVSVLKRRKLIERRHGRYYAAPAFFG